MCCYHHQLLHVHITVDMVDALSMRGEFSHIQWIQQLGWGAPVGVTGFYAGCDEHCDRLRSERSMIDDDDTDNDKANRRRDRDDSIGNN